MLDKRVELEPHAIPSTNGIAAAICPQPQKAPRTSSISCCPMVLRLFASLPAACCCCAPDAAPVDAPSVSSLLRIPSNLSLLFWLLIPTTHPGTRQRVRAPGSSSLRQAWPTSQPTPAARSEPGHWNSASWNAMRYRVDLSENVTPGTSSWLLVGAPVERATLYW